MLHRNKIVYAELPDQYKSRQKGEAKATISLNIVVPKELEKKTEKFMKKCLRDFDEAFNDFIDSFDV